MRTTLTIDDDVAAALERLRKSRDATLKEVINDLLRQGLRETSARTRQRKPYRTRVVHLGASKIGSLDNIGEVLALIEGETYK
jgi:hypothetical protein